jgi:hypothetical protein
MVVAHHLSSTGFDLHDPLLYRSLSPDIVHVVIVVSSFMHKPSLDHFHAVKRIIRDIKGTLHQFGLFLTQSIFFMSSFFLISMLIGLDALTRDDLFMVLQSSLVIISFLKNLKSNLQYHDQVMNLNTEP